MSSTVTAILHILLSEQPQLLLLLLPPLLLLLLPQLLHIIFSPFALRILHSVQIGHGKYLSRALHYMQKVKAVFC